jgi:hypothetical protein
MSNDKMRWACFLWPDHDWRNLQVVKRRGLVVLFNIIKVAKPWPEIRGEVTLYPAGGSPIRMIRDEIDIGDRKLDVLIALYEHPAAKLACGVCEAVGPLMLAIRGPGGIALEDIGPVHASGAGPSALAQEPAVSVRADDSEAESVRSSEPGGQLKESRKEAKRVEREARLVQFADKERILCRDGGGC